jgi:hypothetical protein
MKCNTLKNLNERKALNEISMLFLRYLGLNVVHSVSALVFADITFEFISIDGA